MIIDFNDRLLTNFNLKATFLCIFLFVFEGFFLPLKLTILGKTGIALSQDKLRITETGLNYRQSEAVVSADLPSHAQMLADFVHTNSD